jgi:3-hydroxybutyryl-CoA dehydratase|tara:strand:+ start:197 stop:439 length:243 start_codon:yes stop_codon:yes gene_type:complete
MLLGGLISAALGKKTPGPGAIYISQTLNFLAPVFIGDSVEILVEVMSIRYDKPVVTIKTECKNQNGKIVLEGEAILLIPQ